MQKKNKSHSQNAAVTLPQQFVESHIKVRHLGSKHVRRGVASALIVLTISAVVGAYILRGSLTDFTVGSVRIGRDTERTATIDRLRTAYQARAITVIDKDGKKARYQLADVGLSIDGEGTYDSVRAKQQNAKFWDKLAFWHPITSPYLLRIDDRKLSDFVTTKLTQVIEAPVDSTIDTSGEEVRATPEKIGSAYTIALPSESLKDRAAHHKPLEFTLTKLPLQPAITAASLQHIVLDARAITSTPVTLRIHNDTFQPTPAQITSWVTNDGKNFAFKDELIVQYLKDISSEYESAPSRRVVMRTSTGAEIIIFPGSGGTGVTNIQSVAAQIATSLPKKQTVDATLTLSDAPPQRVVVNEYDKWINVNLSRLRVEAYEKDKLVMAYPASAGLSVSPTLTGEHKIYLKVRSQTMRGITGYGTPYNVPNVQWVNYYSGNYAIHGNYWAKPEYFGAVNSTSGCVGLRNPDAEQLYAWAPIGTPVIVHW